ncbi:MAG: hypothetical protein JO029_08550, partial [Candidatus Eremiobacteraeota bacterium]|nr:hypothetical protein [Candidatus Eremiobacteraeota bacterium]
MLTADYCCGGYANQTPAGGVASAQPWLTYFANPSANSDPTGTYPSYGAPGLAAAGVSPSRVYTYVDDSRIYRGDAQFNNIAPGGAQATAEAVDCFGNPITVNNQNGYLSDPWQLATLQIYDADVTQKFTASTEFGVVFLDDIGAYQFVDNNAVACENGIPWTGMSAAPAYAVIINGINVSGLSGHAPPVYLLNVLAPVLIEANGNSTTLQAMITDFASLTNVVAMDCEGCLADNHNAEIGNSTPFDIANQWILAEDAEIVAVNAQKIFWLQDQDSTS